MRVFPEKRLLRRRGQSPKSGRRVVYGCLLLAFAIGLIALGQAFPNEISDARSRLAGPTSQILALIQAPLKPLANLRQRYDDFVEMEGELARLRAENDELKGWQWRATELERQLSDLSALNKVVYEQGFDYVTTRIMARSIGSVSHGALLGAGSHVGVPAGVAVLNQHGLVGRTFEVGPATSRVLLLTDPGMELPVSIGRGLVTVAAVGAGRGYLEIRDGGRSFDIAVGDEVMTAGEASGMPRGIRVGRVVGSAQGLRILPYADFDRMEFVSILVPKHGQTADGGRRLDAGGAHVSAQLGEDEPTDPEKRAAVEGNAPLSVPLQGN